MSNIIIKENTSNPVSKFSIMAKNKEIPEETIKEIIFLLPVKSLLKFRCVSPSWLSLIDSPYFIKKLLLKSTPKIILNSPDSCFALDINNVEPKRKARVSVLKLCYPHADTFIVGSCNGVLLTRHNSSMLDKQYVIVVLQNPSTRIFHKIPFENCKWPGPKNWVCAPEKFIYGFWNDALADDYKVFRNCQFSGGQYGNSFYSQVDVYSFRKNLWKHIEPFPYYFDCPIVESVFVGGALHWVVSIASWDRSQLIASFDVYTEEYRLVEQPVYSSGDFELNLQVLGGCLSVGCSYSDLELSEVWVMKEYGNVESWFKLLSLRGADIGVESICYLKPLFYSKCGKKVLIERDCRMLLWYDVEKKSAEFVELDGYQVSEQFQGFVHLDSLVKLTSRVPDPVDEKRRTQHNDDKPNNMPKKRDDFLSKGFKLKL